MKKFNLTTIEWDGKAITQAGMYSKIALETYHRGDICEGPSVSSSGLRRLFAKSPAHFHAEWPCNPDHVEREDKAHFVLGRAVHHLLLGEPYFAKLFCVQPDEWLSVETGEVNPWRRGVGGAKFADAWARARAAEGRAVLKAEDVANLRGMAESLARHPIVRAGALNGMIERSIFWRDKETGLWLKVRPDSIPTSSVDFVDLKSTTSVLWADLQRTIAEHGYHAQGALIRSAARLVLGIPDPTFTLIFVEKTPPWCVRVVTLKDVDLGRGERQNRAAIETVARCLKSGEWPGPGGDREDAEHIELPEWSQRQIDDKLEFGIA